MVGDDFVASAYVNLTGIGGFIGAGPGSLFFPNG
jgi:hypothetical protein